MKIQNWLLGVLGMAFFAWAGVVWTGQAEITSLLREFMVSMEGRVTRIETDVQHLEERHNGIGTH